MRKAVAMACVLLATGGCKSEAEKLQELRTAESLSQLRVVEAQREYDAAKRYEVDCAASPAHQRECEKVDSLLRVLEDARVARDLAERNVRRFLGD